MGLMRPIQLAHAALRQPTRAESKLLAAQAGLTSHWLLRTENSALPLFKAAISHTTGPITRRLAIPGR